MWLSLPVTAAPAATGVTSATVTFATGSPFNLTRGAALYSASPGVPVIPGDILESKPDSMLILEFREGQSIAAIVALGPSTRVYWSDRAKPTTLALLVGWIKVDSLAPGRGAVIAVHGRSLGASSGAGTYVVHASNAGDEVFHENGAMTLWVPDADGIGAARESKTNQFATRGPGAEVQLAPRPGAAFNAAMPTAFRDALPAGLSAQLRGKSEPHVVRNVTYEDVADWLTAPRDWRPGFIERFRPRLKDPVFFQALDSHMSAHPEWTRILHPPPPPPPPPPPAPPEAPQPTVVSSPAESAPDGPKADEGLSSPAGQHVPTIIPLPESEAALKGCFFSEALRRQAPAMTVGFLVNVSAQGNVVNAQVIESSGSSAFDVAATSCVQEAAHFSPAAAGSQGKDFWGHLKFDWSTGG